ncbi:LiaI-LiaF-like domain-containing protein [Haloimpatiens sp. FM7315]|uniref:LiaI-LiaF-like domain-containing protein n=1 Tax=Haloimpatiens sp. FM7315 TaxID=3298609 RepID=UPI0035A33EEE
MKRIGTVTTAVSLIFYGAWCIFKNFNYDLAMEIFKFWPLIFIFLGIEFLHFSRKNYEEDRRPKINYFIILVVIIFLNTSLYYNVKNRTISFFGSELGINNDNYKNFFKNGKIIGFLPNKYKKLDSKMSLDSYGKELYMDFSNGKINIENSSDNKITLDLKIYVEKENNINSYNIKSKKEEKGYKIDLKDSEVHGVEGTIYVPEGYYVKLNGGNMDVSSENFSGDVDIDGANCSIDLKGDIQRSNIDISNGKVKIKNELCKDIKIDTSNASVYIDTKDSNLKVEADISNGVCKLNGEKRINSGISKTLGNGEGNIEIDVSNGVVDLNCGE